jgi:pimeloyl-ACP methyl ester carboxylesterase
MAEPLSTTYTRTTEGSYLAYQVTGDGPIDLVIPVTGSAAAELIWYEPGFTRFVSRLASFSRLITFDPRGFGSSGRLDAESVPAVQTWKDDISSVMDAAGSEVATFLAWGEAAGATMFFAATCPERVKGLVLVNSYARYVRSDETPWGLPADLVASYVGAIEHAWGTGVCFEMLAPSVVTTEEAHRQWARIERLTATPDVVAAATRAVFESDVSDVLPAIQSPTLVVSRRGDRHVRHEHSQYVASRIAGAKLLELAGDDHVPFAGDADQLLGEVEEFLTGVVPRPVVDRVLATVLFAEIDRSIEPGEGPRPTVLDDHRAVVRRNLERFRGEETNSAGDGFLVTFDGPTRALSCACAIRDELRTLGIDVRAGVHTGEVERRGDELAGIAVHITARVAGEASAGEVLATRTVRDLVAGSGIGFSDRGGRQLKGVPGTWDLFVVDA